MKTCYWNFYGNESEKVAQHFDKHLREFLTHHSLDGLQSGVEKHPQSAAARTWCKVEDENFVTLIQEKLKPNLIA